jgi:hypothetical protein
MTKKKEEAGNQELQKLLGEYDANSGMAGLVCSRPVELMPGHEQDRIVNGFCTPENLKILSDSREKLTLLKDVDLSESEKKKLGTAISKLGGIIEAFTTYKASQASREELRGKVRKLLHRPIAESRDGLIGSLSHLIETLDFLATQPLDAKDSWDRMVDCVQMHDALSRAIMVCGALQALMTAETEPAPKRSEAIAKTLTFVSDSREALESFFKGDLRREELQVYFTALADGLKKIWVEAN